MAPRRQFSTGVFSQILWPGIGGGVRDDCAILSDYMSVHGAHPELSLPSLTTYRSRAVTQWSPGGLPDTDTGSEGLFLEASLAAIHATWPSVAVELYRGAWATFLTKLKAASNASCSILAGALPARLQHGYLKNHRVTVWWDGTTLRILDPLARAHSKGKPITAAELQHAMAAYPSTEPACALLFA